MNDQTQDYHTTQTANRESYSQNNRDKKFSVERAADPDIQKILGARMDVITDPQLSDGARNLFTLLLDLCLDPQLNNRKRGEICISNTQLRERLSRSARAIYGWTQELCLQRHIWVSKKRRPNMKPMNVFHITKLQPVRQMEVEVAGDGLWGNGYRRPDAPMPLGARGQTCKKRQVLFDQFGAPLFSMPAQKQAPNGNLCGSHPQTLREPPAQKDTCHPQSLREDSAYIAGATRTKAPLPPANIAGDSRREGQSLRETRDVSPRRTETFNNVQRGHAYKKGGESGFLNHVAEVMAGYSKEFAKEELKTSGAWWRMKFRADPDKASRVLAEIKTMITEGATFSQNPGAAAVDLWGRFA